MTAALETLKTIPQWVAWKTEERRGKLTKIPKNPHTGGNALSTEPATWSDYRTAVIAQEQYGFDGVGVVFSTKDDLAGIDLDDCLDPETGHLADWAALIVEQADSYTEISPSGRGLKIFFRGQLPPGGRRKGKVELYEKGRYFTVTGRHWPGSPETINDRTGQVATIHRSIFAPIEEEDHPTVFPENRSDTLEDDEELITKALQAANGSKFRQLWNGETASYRSTSEADLALCNILAFWTGNDADRIDRLYRRSKLFSTQAEKWDKKHFTDGRTYGRATIEKAIIGQQTIYSPRSGTVNGNGSRDNKPTDDPAGSQDAGNKQEHIPFYNVKHGQMVYNTWKTVSGDLILVEKYVAPFVAHIEEKLTVYDETGQEVIYTLAGKKGKRPFTAKITADEWADPKKIVSCILRYLPGKPPDTDPNLRKHWGPAIAHLTDERNMRQINAIPSTGWSPDGRGFVMPQGGVGQSYVCHLDDAMAYELDHFGLKKQTAAENRQALAALLWLVKIYRRSVVYTTLAHAFLAPLLRWVGDEARYLYHIHAETGSLKTEMAKIIIALYGPLGTAGITYKWSNTPIGAESRAYTLKDCLMLIDDLKPGTISEQDKQKWVAFVQAAVDALGRKRATISGKAATSLPPRSLILSTGEAIPEAGEASYTARMLLAELNRIVQPGERNLLLDRLKTYKPLMSGLMYDYIDWLLQADGQGALDHYRQIQQQSSVATYHARIASNFASNRLGAVMLAKFCREKQYMTTTTSDNFLRRHHQALLSVVASTDDKAHSERYSQRFISALKDALDTGYCYLSNTMDREKRVGWEDDQYIYLLNGAKEIVDQWLRQSGQTPINISKRDLRKQLYDDGLSYSTTGRVDRGQYDYQALDPANDSKPMVTALFKDNFNRVINDE